MSEAEICIVEEEIAVFFLKFYCSHVEADGFIIRYALIQSAIDKMEVSFPRINIPYKRYIQIFESFGAMMVSLGHFRKCGGIYHVTECCNQKAMVEAV